MAMPLKMLNHVQIRTSKLDDTRNFFVDVLGLIDGFRPNFPERGHWLYCEGDDAPFVHLTEDPCEGQPRTVKGATGTGVDHMALFGTDVDAMIASLENNNVDYDKVVARGGVMVQLYVHEPNGLKIELGFFPEEEKAAAG
jgi:catechol 2,3-dioxygenase-like lactoylglutathione lyase family enzyme